MADYKYAYNGPTKGVAKAVLIDVPVSTKVSVEICNYLRGKNVAKARHLLELVLKKEHAIPFKRFTDGVGHRKGAHISSGRYPKVASEEFLRLFKLVEANASVKGLAEDLVISHLCAHKAGTSWHFGRQRRRKMKRTHLEIVVSEDKSVKKSSPKKSVSKADESVSKKEVAKQPVKEPVKSVIKEESLKKTVKPVKEDLPVEKKVDPVKKSVESDKKEVVKNSLKEAVKPADSNDSKSSTSSINSKESPKVNNQ